MKRAGSGRQKQAEGDPPREERKAEEERVQSFPNVADFSKAGRSGGTKFDTMLRNEAERELQFSRSMDTTERRIQEKQVAQMKSQQKMYSDNKNRGKQAVKPTNQWKDPSTSKEATTILGIHPVVDAVYASVETRDHTVHLELDLSEDYDQELEQFNKLIRIGDFSKARSFFGTHLKTYIGNPNVFVQYAEMLLEQGDFKSLSLIDGSLLFDEQDSPGDMNSDFESRRRLALNWQLMQALALCSSQHDLDIVWKDLNNLNLRTSREAWCFGSTEASPNRLREKEKNKKNIYSITNFISLVQLKILLLTMQLIRHVPKPMSLYNLGSQPLSHWADWKMMYRKLLSEDRIWDFRDAFLSASACYGTENALRAFVDYDSPIQGLLEDWQTYPEYDSTNLALLDLLSNTALNNRASADARYLAETCVQLAESVGNSLLNNSPHLVESRPFIRWVLAKSVVKSSGGGLKQLTGYPGLFLLSTEGLPFYIPVFHENPGWLPLNSTPTAQRSLNMALKSCRELQDYKTEVMCLTELALRAQHPGELFRQLEHLQHLKQHNVHSYLSTLVSRYLICMDGSSRKALLEALQKFESWEDSSRLINTAGAAARAVLLRALSQHPAKNPAPSVSAALKYYYNLPENFREILHRHDLVPHSIVSRERRKSPSTTLRKGLQRRQSSQMEANIEERKKDQGSQPQNAVPQGDIKDPAPRDHYQPPSSQNLDRAEGKRPLQSTKNRTHQSDRKDKKVNHREDRLSEGASDRSRPRSLESSDWYDDSEDSRDFRGAAGHERNTKSSKGSRKAMIDVESEYTEDSSDGNTLRTRPSRGPSPERPGVKSNRSRSLSRDK